MTLGIGDLLPMVINHLPPGPGSTRQPPAAPQVLGTVPQSSFAGARGREFCFAGAPQVGQGERLVFFWGVGKTLGVATWEGHEKKMQYIYIYVVIKDDGSKLEMFRSAIFFGEILLL